MDEIIRKRRSIRKYRAEKPDESLIRAMVESACFAPSPSHSQPVRFFRIENETLKKNLLEFMEKGRDRLLGTLESKGGDRRTKNLITTYFRFAGFMFQAPCLFAVGTVKTRSLSSRLIEAGVLSENPKGHSDEDISTGLALSTFMLKGAELGVGTCVLTAPFVYIPDLSEKIAADARITCFVTAGYPDEQPGPLTRIGVDDLCQTI